MQRYSIQDANGRAPLAIVKAETPLGALDAYCDLEGIARYSETMQMRDDAEDLTYWLDGLLGAVFSNYEIVAYPINEAGLELAAAQSGYGVWDAAGVFVADAIPERRIAEKIVEGGLWNPSAISLDEAVAKYPPHATVISHATGVFGRVITRPALGINGAVCVGVVWEGDGDGREIVKADDLRVVGEDTAEIQTDDDFAADALEYLAGIDEGENTDYDRLLEVARKLRERAGTRETV